MGPNGSPRKSVSSPATITRKPRAVSSVARSAIFQSKNWASSMPTTVVSGANCCKISAALATGVASNSVPACEVTFWTE